MSPERKKQPTAAVSEEERSEMRSLLGSLQWLCQQTRVDIAVSVNKMAQRITKATVRDLLECNAIGKRVLETPDLGITLPRGVFDAKNCALVGFGDAAFANEESVKSQFGEVVLACKPNDVEAVCNGRYDLAVLLSWRSGTIKRVVRSTLAAEGYAISETSEQVEWIAQCQTGTRHGGDVDLKDVENRRRRELALCTQTAIPWKPPCPKTRGA